MNTIPIVFAFDANFEMPAGVCIYSLLSNADSTTFYDIFILHNSENDFSNSRIRLFEEIFPQCRITFRCVNGDFHGAYEIRGITETAYYRLLIPKLILEYDKVLYSDVDVIIREDLTKYYALALDDYYFASVNLVPVMDSDLYNYVKSLGMQPSDGYFYSGNIIVNSKLLRVNDKVNLFLSHQDKRYRFQDMDIINMTCGSRIKSLSPAFCLTNTYYQAILNERERLKTYYTEEEMAYALKYGIVHYNGAKPWKDVCLNMDIWWEYYRKSIFFDEKFAYDFWFNQTYRIEKMSLWKRIKQVARYFRKGGRM